MRRGRKRGDYNRRGDNDPDPDPDEREGEMRWMRNVPERRKIRSKEIK